MDSRKSARISREMKQGIGTEGQGAESTMDLTEFLAEAQLAHYLTALRNELKVTCVEHLKYVKEEDLEGIGMTRPEMRRLKKFYKKEHPQGTFGKLKKAILRSGGGETGRSSSPPAPDHRASRPVSLLRPAGKIVIPVDCVAMGKTVGQGHFGTVQVALKRVEKNKVPQMSDEVLKEVAVLQAIDHENIVRLYGVVTVTGMGLMLVTELAPMRSLLECLKEGSGHVDFPVPRLCDFAQQVCDGMSYLESKHLVHRDLAARNVMVFSKSKVKISDVGVTGLLGVDQGYYLSQHSRPPQTPVAWCAPECCHELQFTSATDVWAFGVTLWEFFTYGAQPWAGLNPQQIMENVDEPQSLRLDQPDLCPKEYYSLMLKCWQHDPERRPTFSQLFLTLPQIRPVQVKAVKDAVSSPTQSRDHLQYSNYDIIVVLDKSPTGVPSGGLWRGCVSGGQSGLFNPTHTVPYVEPKTSPISLPKTSLSRKESGRSSKRSKLRTDMIGAPQNDLRHTGHIGYDGAVFGDVSFIGDNYDKLPVRVGASGKVDVSRGSSLSSIPRTTDSPDRNGFVKTSTSDDSLDRRNYGHSWISQESLASTQDDQHDGFMDTEDNSIFADFKMPDLSSSFDLGPSFMDEVLKALNEKEKQAEAASSPAFNGCDFGDDIDPNRVNLDDKTPLAEDEKTPVFEEKGFGYAQSSVPFKQRASPPPLPANPPRVDVPREKKQAKVKPMSASEEKMMEDAITLANEVTATRAQRHSQSQSPPQSPTSEKAAMDFPDSVLDPSPSLICKLKNSIRRSPKTERKRTFSDDHPPKGDVEEDFPPGAQEAYNALVVRGSDKQGDKEDQAAEERLSVSSDAVFTSELGDSHPAEARVPSVGASQIHVSSSKGSGMPQPPPRPMPKPRLDSKKSDLPIPKPRPEIIQRVEPIRRPPDSPEVPLKEKDSQIPVLATRKESWSDSKEREREQLKKTIEIVRMESPAREEVFSAGPDLDTKESTPEPDSDSTRQSSASEGGDSSTKVMSLFEEDFSEPSPREIMSKLARESRMRRNMDHQRVLSGENQDTQAASMTRARREPSGIPAKMTAPPAEEADRDEEEVDTNPLRMLRGGAIPIRTSRGAGNSSSKSSGSALHYPKFGFQSAGFREGGEERGSMQAAPHLPPRTRSVSSDAEVGVPSSPRPQDGHEAVPTVPPRTPLRQHSMPTLNSRPRERRHPLVYNKTSECDSPSLTPPLSSSSTDPSTPPLPASNYSASFDASSSLPSPSQQAFLPSVSLHDEPCPPDLPPAPARPRPHPLTLAMQNNVVPNTGASLSVRSDLASHHYYGVDESTLDSTSPSAFLSSRRPLPHVPPSPHSSSAPSCSSGSSRQSAYGRKFALHSVQCSLEQLGFYNQHDPFWGQTVLLPDRTPALDSTASSEEVSPLLLVNYKNSDNVSYEDLLDFGLDRQKNGEEVETLQKILDNEVSYEECRTALEETQGDLGQAVKYIRLKQLLSLHLADVHTCKRALMSKSWDVHRAADHLLTLQQSLHTHTPSSPESLEV